MAKEAVKIQEGGVIDYTAAATIANGDVIPFADSCGVALDDAVSGDAISVALEGVWEITANTANTIAVGAILYFDAVDRDVTTDEDTGTNKRAGIATTAKAGATAGSVYVKIG